MASYIPRPTPVITGRVVQAHYTVREMFEELMFELNKVSAPSIDVETFNKFHNTARDNYYKKRYNLYDTGQQTTDDMSDLSATTVFSLATTPPLNVPLERFDFPPFYYHALSVDVFWKALSNFRIYRQGDVFNHSADRIAAEKLSKLRGDYYNRPQYNKPYFLARRTYIELHTGKHDQLELQQVEITYLLLAEKATLLETDLDDLTIDPSQVLSEKGVVTLEVLKELVHLVMENQTNQRLPGKVQVDQAVPNQPPQAANAPAPRQR